MGFFSKFLNPAKLLPGVLGKAASPQAMLNPASLIPGKLGRVASPQASLNPVAALESSSTEPSGSASALSNTGGPVTAADQAQAGNEFVEAWDALHNPNMELAETSTGAL